jgi:hypothetical protein
MVFNKYKVKSKFLKEIIKDTHISNKKKLLYVMELTFIEKAINKGILGNIHNFFVNKLIHKYEFEYLQMLKELNYEKYKKIIKDKERKLLNHEEIETDITEIEKEIYNWLKLNGGKTK